MTTRYVEHNRSITCVECHETFDAAHYDAEFCSANCRKRRQRKLERIDRCMDQALAAIEALKTYHGKAGHNKAFDAVERIAKRSASIRDYWES